MESGEIKGFIILGIRLRKTRSIKRLVLNFIMGSSSKMLQITSLEFSQLSQNSQKKRIKMILVVIKKIMGNYNDQYSCVEDKFDRTNE